MKTFAAELACFVRRPAAQNLRRLLLYCTFLVTIMVLGYALLFLYLMQHLEGRAFSLIASIYWTIPVLTTLGFGDITFHSDPGLQFAALVTISGVIFLLIFQEPAAEAGRVDHRGIGNRGADGLHRSGPPSAWHPGAADGAVFGHRARGGDGPRPDWEPRAGVALQPGIPVTGRGTE